MKKKQKKITGILSKHRRGFGFVIPDDREAGDKKGDIFISSESMGTAMDKDRVSVKISSGGSGNNKAEGVIDRIVERSKKEIVGTLITRGDHGYIVPVRSRWTDDILIAKRNFNGAKSGDMVAVDIIKWPTGNRRAEGKVKEIIGRKGEAGSDIKGLIRAFNVRENFSAGIAEEADSVCKSIEEEDLSSRRDLRDKHIITIDGADAKDLDDAISVEKTDSGNFLLGVHIADVSHYVKEGGALDKEALKRGTSIYLIDRVVPMLPAELSNGICSLSPGVDRLCLSITMEISNSGQVLWHDIYKSVIRSKDRMIYTEVSEMLENHHKELIDKYDYLYPQLLLMEELASALAKSRKEKGSLDFDIDEARITLDKDGMPASVEAAERRIANRIIEEFMLVANRTIAEHFFHLELPFVYRVHEKPATEKIFEFKRFLASLGISFKGNPENLHPKSLDEVLDSVRGTDKENVINTVMLRSMKKALYNVECLGHFGLGMKYYCHFTAPIRRYPDLIIHRIIKEFLSNEIDEERIKTLEQKTYDAAENSSLMERKAEELEREVERLKKAEYMSRRVGEDYRGIISGMATYGFFVQIENTVEGLVRIDSLGDDYYIYEEEKYRFIGENSKKIYGLGNPVTITVDFVDIAAREILFVVSDLNPKKKG